MVASEKQKKKAKLPIDVTVYPNCPELGTIHECPSWYQVWLSLIPPHGHGLCGGGDWLGHYLVLCTPHLLFLLPLVHPLHVLLRRTEFLQSFLVLSVQSDAPINQPRNGLGLVAHLALRPLIARMNQVVVQHQAFCIITWTGVTTITVVQLVMVRLSSNTGCL
jgi:hypothetical protein